MGGGGGENMFVLGINVLKLIPRNKSTGYIYRKQCILHVCIVVIYKGIEGVGHRVGRVLSVSPVVGIGTPPPL
jgi:hypothetical protein